MTKKKVCGFTLQKSIWSASDLTPHERLVCLAIMDHADATGECFPAQKGRLESMTGLERHAIGRLVDSLAQKGYLSKRARPTGRGYIYAALLDHPIFKHLGYGTRCTTNIPDNGMDAPKAECKGDNGTRCTMGNGTQSAIGYGTRCTTNIPDNNIPDNNIPDNNIGGYTTLEAISKTNIGGYSINSIDPGNSIQPSQPPPVADFKNKKETPKMQNKFAELSPLEKRVAARLNMLGMSDAIERVIAAREAFAKESWSSTNADNELFKIAREIEPSASAPHFEPQPEPTPPPAATQQSMDFAAPATTSTATPAASAVFSLESFDTFAAWLRRRDVWTQLKPLVEPHLTAKDASARKAECRNIFAAVYAKIRNRRDIRNARGLIANILRDDIDELKRGAPKDEPRDLDSILAALATDFAAIYPKQASHMADILSVDRIPRSILAYLSGLEAANWDGVRSPIQKVKSALTGYVYESIGYAREEDIKDLRREIAECMRYAADERSWVRRYREDGLDAEAAKCEDKAKKFDERLQAAQNELIALESA